MHTPHLGPYHQRSASHSLYPITLSHTIFLLLHVSDDSNTISPFFIYSAVNHLTFCTNIFRVVFFIPCILNAHSSHHPILHDVRQLPTSFSLNYNSNFLPPNPIVNHFSYLNPSQLGLRHSENPEDIFFITP